MRIFTSGLIACLACAAAFEMRPLLFADQDAQFCMVGESDVPSERIEACSRILARNLDKPGQARAYGSRGKAHWHNGETLLALADYNAALAIQPTGSAVLYDRALGYVDVRQFDEALADLDRVIAADPEAPKGYSGRGWANFQKGDYDLAVADFDKVESLQADNAWAHNIRAFALDKLGRKPEATAEFRRAAELEPSNTGFVEDLKTAEAEQE